MGEARTDLRSTLARWELSRLSDEAELVLSELMANALRHARVPQRSRIETRYVRGERAVRIEVHDASDVLPQVRNPVADDEGGRGLAFVDALTAGRWGVAPSGDGGKAVWAVVGDG
ncbi:ATP-binding protein [Streptomyces sp.]|uniref:ATP-binding protein n=1 Tax=Streptomyces sp. TaxID=1931 RepID=UPI002F3E66E0